MHESNNTPIQRLHRFATDDSHLTTAEIAAALRAQNIDVEVFLKLIGERLGRVETVSSAHDSQWTTNTEKAVARLFSGHVYPRDSEASLSLKGGLKVDRAGPDRNSRRKYLLSNGQKICQLCEHMHSINHIVRDTVVRTAPGRELCASPGVAVGKLILICDEVRSVFGDVFAPRGGEFRVTIKSFRSHHRVMTIARDSGAIHRLGVDYDTNRSWEVLKETAFRQLYSPSERCFACDDLTSADNYQNSSPDWKSRYTATMVVPIRMEMASRSGNFNHAGYLAVDCLLKKKGQIFCNSTGLPRTDARDFMLAVADAIFPVVKRCILSPAPHADAGYYYDREHFAYVAELQAAFTSEVRMRASRP